MDKAPLYPIKWTVQCCPRRRPIIRRSTSQLPPFLVPSLKRPNTHTFIYFIFIIFDDHYFATSSAFSLGRSRSAQFLIEFVENNRVSQHPRFTVPSLQKPPTLTHTFLYYIFYHFRRSLFRHVIRPLALDGSDLRIFW